MWTERRRGRAMASDQIDASLAFNSNFPSSDSSHLGRDVLPDAKRDTVWHQYCTPETQDVVDWILLMSHAMLSSPEYRLKLRAIRKAYPGVIANDGPNPSPRK